MLACELQGVRRLRMLATIHQSVSYQHMIAHMEGTSKQAMRGGATYWLRILLQLVAAFTLNKET